MLTSENIYASLPKHETFGRRCRHYCCFTRLLILLITSLGICVSTYLRIDVLSMYLRIYASMGHVRLVRVPYVALSFSLSFFACVQCYGLTVSQKCVSAEKVRSLLWWIRMPMNQVSLDEMDKPTPQDGQQPSRAVEKVRCRCYKITSSGRFDLVFLFPKVL